MPMHRHGVGAGAERGERRERPGPANSDRSLASTTSDLELDFIEGDMAYRENHDGALAKSIKRWSISFLLFGCAAMVIAYVIAALIGMPDWLGEVKDELEHSELTCVPKPPPPPPPHTLC